MSYQSIKFKHRKQVITLMFMHPLIVMVMFDMAFWCDERNIDYVVTDTISTIEEDKELNRVSDSHRTKRAFDLRSWTFTSGQIDEFIKHFNEKYEDIASISASDLVQRLVVIHGEGDQVHFHIAIHSRYRIND